MDNKKYVGGTRKDNSVWYAKYIISSELPSREFTTATIAVPFYKNKIVVEIFEIF